ncbi:hypothetical protein [Pseudoalteromonas sp. G4]|uniref:hypothetical protein n=1 Tax=Pseudoalteromonas sp. G4 TaxID=2992761 RepID=UPI00237D9B43|nr:hypothetical protein [Pseudoalteromonas sp. G4]MDE3272864.1 hypothetical protein [Pseudoalteromonas sp. G4]
MDNNPTVKIIVDLDGIFEKINDNTVYCKNNYALVGDKFISYDVIEGDTPSVAKITLDNTTTPPTIKLIGESQEFDFEVYKKSTKQPATDVFLDWFHDSALQPLKLNIESYVISYQSLASKSLDITMTLVAKNPVNQQEYTIGWDPIIEVDDVDPQ